MTAHSPAFAQPDGIDPVRAAQISARIDRLPAVSTIWRLVALLSIGFFFELATVAMGVQSSAIHR